MQSDADKEKVKTILGQRGNYVWLGPTRDRLVNMGKPAVPGLIDALKSNDDDIRTVAIWSLDDIRDPRALPALIELIRNGDTSYHEIIVTALGNIGDKRAVPDLLKALKEPKLSDKAAEALGKIGDTHAVGPLVELLQEGGGGCAIALDKLGWKPGSVSEKFFLYRHTGKTDELVKLGEPAVPELLQIYSTNTFDFIRREAADILYRIGWRPSSINDKISFYESMDNYDEVVRLGKEAVAILVKEMKTKGGKFAATALGKIGDKAVLPDVREAYDQALQKQDDMTLIYLSYALWSLGDSRGLHKLFEELTANNGFTITDSASDTLRDVGSPAVDGLIDILKNGSQRAKSWAAITLGKIGDSKAVPALRSVLNRDFEPANQREFSDHLSVVRDVKEALSKIDEQGELIRVKNNLKSEDGLTRMSAVQDAGKSKDKTSVPDLISILSRSNDDMFMQVAVIQSLGQIGDAGATSALMAKLTNRKGPNNIRIFALRALVLIEDQSALPGLKQALSDEDPQSDIYSEIQSAIRSIEHGRAIIDR